MISLWMEDSRGKSEADHVDAALLVPVRSIASADSANTGCDIGGHRHELSRLGSVTHAANDGGEEDGDGVDWQIDTEGDEHVNPDLPVLERVLDELALELVRQDRGIFFETSDDLPLLLVGKELGSAGVVVESPEGVHSCTSN